MPLETVERTLAREEQAPAVAPPQVGAPEVPVRIEPDLDFIRTLMKAGGDSLKKCMQCGTCSATCSLASDVEPFPRKEMAWAAWGMKDVLLKDPDVWLCHQCNDCSTRCPRGAKPGDVLAAVRQEWVIQQAFPRFLARWARQPQSIPTLLGIMTALLALALYLKDPIAGALGISDQLSSRILYSYSSMLPRWLLNSFFLLFGIIVMIPITVGSIRLWRRMKAVCLQSGLGSPARKLLPSAWSALKSIITHEKFALCTEARPRYLSHLFVFFGFLSLGIVTLWVITAPYNPLTGDFVYPLNFWNPFKILANAGGVVLIVGCVLMAKERLKNSAAAGANTYSDWGLIVVLSAVALTGFIAEALHYVRLEPHRHLAYFVHLVFVGTLLLYMPYSKFAHILYRTSALFCAERYNRMNGKQPGESRVPSREEVHAEEESLQHV